VEENLADICASMQNILIKILLQKLRKASREYKIKEIAIAGGVSANSGLRSEIQKLGEIENWNVYIPAFQYCTDNAGMIAMAGHFKAEQGEFCSQEVSPLPRMEFKGVVSQ
jgi:N6-L-threonylcarbamoyladenine synthase